MSPHPHTFRTRSGLLVRVRPVVPGDAPALVDLFAHLSPQSRFQRFNRQLDAPPDDEVQRESLRLAQLEPAEGVGWLAEADLPGQPGAPVGIVRYRLVPPNAAEAAVAVRDDLQGLGIGTWLLLFAAEQAQAAGVQTLFALVRQDNLPVGKLLDRSPFPLKRVARGEYEYVQADLRPPAPDYRK